jgi:hypothetical protein
MMRHLAGLGQWYLDTSYIPYLTKMAETDPAQFTAYMSELEQFDRTAYLYFEDQLTRAGVLEAPAPQPAIDYTRPPPNIPSGYTALEYSLGTGWQWFVLPNEIAATIPHDGETATQNPALFIPSDRGYTVDMLDGAIWVFPATAKPVPELETPLTDSAAPIPEFTGPDYKAPSPYGSESPPEPFIETLAVESQSPAAQPIPELTGESYTPPADYSNGAITVPGESGWITEYVQLGPGDSGGAADPVVAAQAANSKAADFGKLLLLAIAAYVSLG